MHALAMIALFAGSSLAAPASLADCVASEASHLASFPECATDRSLLAHCLSGLDAPVSQEYVASCHVDAGCSPSEATSEAATALSRCHVMINGADLRRRNVERFAGMPLLGRQETLASSVSECFDIDENVPTTVCKLTTENGIEKTVGTCDSTTVTTSSCKAGKTCSINGAGNDVCMDLKDDLDVAGIVIAIVFAAVIVIGVGTLTWLCCKDRKEQKRLQAKAEATALARAATKKKRAAEMRQPLMAQQQQAPGPDTSALGGADPFHDGYRS